MILGEEDCCVGSSGLSDEVEAVKSPRLPETGDRGSKSSRERLAIC